MSDSQHIAYKAISMVFRLLSLVPRAWSARIGSVLGRIWFLADTRHRDMAIDNLTRAYTNEKTPQEVRILARQVFKNIGQMIFEVPWSLRLNEKNLDQYFTINGIDHFKAAHEKGKGVLLLSAHLGNWELLSVVGGIIHMPVSNLYRPLDFEPLDRFMTEVRTRFGLKLIPAKRAMRKILSALKQGEGVSILLDQNVDWYDGVFVEFFGRRTCTSSGLALLALKFEAPVVPLFIARQGSGFRVEFGKEIPLIKTGDKTKDVEDNTQQYNKVLEAFIRRYPDQWLWVHNRWQTKPYHPWPREDD